MFDLFSWEPFRIEELFEVYLPNGDIKQSTCESGDIPLVSSGSSNNGVVAYTNGVCDNPSTLISGNCLTVDMFGEAYYQPTGFYCVSHGRVNILKPRSSLTYKQLLFICTVIKHEKYRTSYGRAMYSDGVKKLSIYLPAKDGQPDWQGIEDYMTSIYSYMPKSLNPSKNERTDISNWKTFVLEDLFSIKKGKRLTKENQIEGETPFIGAIDSNNGVSNYIGQTAIHRGNTITLTYNGSVGEAFYQDKDFWASDDVNVLYPKFQLTRNIAMFICTILRLEKYRYTYGRKWVLEKMKKTQIMLPALTGENGKVTPDWQYMEEYIKSLPYGDCI